MMILPMQSSVIYIGQVPNGCCSTEFNTNYPPQLNGIISPNEFRESIAKINAVNRSGVPLLICLAIFLVCVITGIVLCVLGTTTSSSSGSAGFAVLTGVGGGIIALGIVSVIVSCCFIHIMLRKRLEPVVAEEEARYASRSATPCRWRLNPKTREPGDPYVRRGCGVNYILIDIADGAQTGIGLPLNNRQAAAGFCPQCGTPRSDLRAKFCPSCGGTFNQF